MTEGRCLCGAVSYRFDGPPVMSAICHCTHCQRQSGSLFSMVLGVPRADFQVTGTPSAYRDKGDSGLPVDRLFCGKCGSPIASFAEAMPDVVFVKAGTLEGWSAYPPNLEIYRSRAADWLPLFHGAQSFSEAPPVGEASRQ